MGESVMDIDRLTKEADKLEEIGQYRLADKVREQKREHMRKNTSWVY